MYCRPSINMENIRFAMGMKGLPGNEAEIPFFDYIVVISILSFRLQLKLMDIKGLKKLKIEK